MRYLNNIISDLFNLKDHIQSQAKPEGLVLVDYQMKRNGKATLWDVSFTPGGESYLFMLCKSEDTELIVGEEARREYEQILKSLKTPTNKVQHFDNLISTASFLQTTSGEIIKAQRGGLAEMFSIVQKGDYLDISFQAEETCEFPTGQLLSKGYRINIIPKAKVEEFYVVGQDEGQPVQRTRIKEIEEAHIMHMQATLAEIRRYAPLTQRDKTRIPEA